MQTSVATKYAAGRTGMIADARIMRHVHSKLAGGRVKAGLGVFRVPTYGAPGGSAVDPGTVWQNPEPALAADPDAIIATIASAAAPQTLTQANADGIHGANLLMPARTPTLTLSNSADWDATNAILTYVNELYRTVTHTFAVPDGGNTTLTATGKFMRQFVSLFFPAQSGVGGTADLGVAALDASIVLGDFEGIAVFDAMVEPYDTIGSDAAEYKDADTVPVLRRGAIWVIPEGTITAGQDAFVRVAAGAGGSQLGALRGDADTASAVAIPGRFLRDSVNSLNILELEG